MSENRNHTSLSQNIIMELCSAIRRFQKRIPHFEERGEVQITADLHDSVEGILNSKYKQLMGYLNPYFKFGITLSLNRKMSLKQGFDEIENELKTIDGDFAPINIQRIGESETLMIVSEHIVPETACEFS